MEHATRELAPILVHQVSYLWLIPFFPLLGSVINALFGWQFERAGKKQLVHVVAIGAMACAFAVAVRAFVQMYGLDAEHRFLQDTLWNLLTAGRLTVDLAFALDPLSMMMVLIITFIGTLIHVFSVGYMWDDVEAYWRFFTWLNLFVFSMLLLVMGDNFAVMFFGWEGVGLCSYGLISYYYKDREKAGAGMKAFVVNRFGDFGFIIGMLLLFWGLGGGWGAMLGARGAEYQPAAAVNAVAGAATRAESMALAPQVEVGEGQVVKVGPTLNFRELRDQVVIEKTGVMEHLKEQKLWGIGLLALIGVFLFVGAMGKSAQLPLYVWLPDAMAGPTPVSALIHAATMVTAGVYMVARLNFLFALAPSAMGWVALIGAVTAIFAASIGFFQYDIKKVLAYSTVSQLGFMFIGVGVGAYWAGTYHLLTHAFFKATLFLGSGSVILGCHHEQDMRKMGGLAKHMPVTRWTYLIACWAIAGFPWASGFYSKDEILWKAFTSRNLELFGLATPWLGPAIYVVGIVAATGTAFYMFRSYYMTFSGTYRGGAGHHDEHDEDPHAALAAPHHATSAHPQDGALHAIAAQQEQAAHVAHGHGAHAPAAHDAHGHAGGHGGHGGTPHESPLSITFVLTTLAAGAVLVSLLGIPAAWTHTAPILERWLEPVLLAEVPFAEQPHWMELLFQAIGVGAGVVGWVCARALYKDDVKHAALEAFKQRFFGVWTVVYNKYYVDEAYQKVVLAPALAFARLMSWIDSNVIDWLVNAAGAVTRLVANFDGLIDKYLVDGAVTAVANLTLESGRGLRRIQTGRVQTYLYGIMAGALVLVLFNFVVR
ncbi:MAG TPA: NADH-quinone oxidoreductase subunit L [Anaeromyxobacteraceae bacterium]|nr:NADH-quinone oxidoreductase subunit L [Anaeromyxobacteraceae bacterium]